MIRLAGIHLYPLKSGAAQTVLTTEIALDGLRRDRRMMVVDASGTCITSRKAPGLLTIAAEHDGETLVLLAPGRPPLALDAATFLPAARQTEIWGDRLTTLDAGDAAAAWLSGYLQVACRLAVAGPETKRPLHLAPGGAVNLADTAPLLLASRESLAAFNHYLDDPVEMARFRPNLVIAGAEAFAEDGWRRIRIGAVEFIVAGACDRCVVTTLDPVTGIARSDREPLTTLARIRRAADGNVYFGQFLVPLHPGRVHAGDTLTVLETSAPKIFLPAGALKRKTPPAHHLGAAKPGPLALRCVGIVDDTHDTRCFRFRPVAGAVWPYRAGQFMTLILPMAGGAVRRNYTISSSPTRPEILEITVKRVPGGLGSNWLHDNLKPGDELTVDGPSGRFCLGDTADRGILMLAAGSGITPMLSMLRSLIDADHDTRAHLHVSARSEADLIADAELRLLAARGRDRLSYSRNLTRAAAQGEAPRRLDIVMLDRHCPNWRDREVYCCGPQEYRAHVRDLLRGIVPPDRYHEESFGAPGAVEASSYTVLFQRSGRRVSATDNRTLLQIAREAGIEIASACEAGVCGTCRCQRISGDLDGNAGDDSYSILDDAELADGFVLACSVRPRGEVVIDL